jgi:hypothetical protein
MKYLKLFLIAALIPASVLAQRVELPSHVEAAPHVSNHISGINQSKAHWDIDLSMDVTTPSNTIGQAAVAYINNQIWTSRWASDTIIIHDISGNFLQKFTIPGLAGTRSITTDGTSLYFANATNTIYIVDPVALTVSGTIASSASVTSRFLTFDSTLDGGMGGFWTGNFNTDIVAINMSGTPLTSIPAATHGLGGMYGAAVDNSSFGGPYLWVFHQGGANSATLTAIELTSGIQTSYSRDVFTDISSAHGLQTGLAGGAFLTNDFIPGETTLIGLVQGNPRNVVVGYEIDLTPIEDVAITKNRGIEGYTLIPESQVFSEVFEITYANLGTVSVDTLFVDMDFYHDGIWLSNSTAFDTNVAVGTNGVLPFSFTPNSGVGLYTARAVARTHLGMNDSNPLNDTLTFNFEVTDSIFARDNNISTGVPYSVSQTASSIASSVYEITSEDTITGIWIRLENPTHGDTTYGVIYSYNGSSPSTLIASSPEVIIDSAVNIYYLKFQNEVVLTPGKYAFGCYEGAGTGIQLAQSNDLSTSNTIFTFSSGIWTEDTTATSLFIRPILGKYISPNASILEFNLDQLQVYPNPTKDYITVPSLSAFPFSYAIEVVNSTGNVVSSYTGFSNATMVLNLSHLAAGYYRLQFKTKDGIASKALFIE